MIIMISATVHKPTILDDVNVSIAGALDTFSSLLTCSSQGLGSRHYHKYHSKNALHQNKVALWGLGRSYHWNIVHRAVAVFVISIFGTKSIIFIDTWPSKLAIPYVLNAADYKIVPTTFYNILILQTLSWEASGSLCKL